ncbi:formin-like protein 5 [Ananas comosus]|uniref:Formin-like protein 5 n=1 Tax=Ananas comosus TaxID=4615 RepID=A0A6P5G6Z6_ANACO|nr:formin-like protein 5 [Ananas comosus]
MSTEEKKENEKSHAQCRPPRPLEPSPPASLPLSPSHPHQPYLSPPHLPPLPPALLLPLLSPKPYAPLPPLPLPPPPPPPQLYPVAVAVAAGSHHRALCGIGFPPKPSSRAPPPPLDQSVTVANPAGYIPNASPTAVMNLPGAAAAPQARPFVYGVPDHAAAHAMRPPPMQAQQPLPPLAIARPVAAAGGGGSGVVSLAVPPKGVPAAAHSKVCSLPTVSSAHDYGNSKERDRSGEDTLMTIHSRKVRILDSESPSLYSLCRAWLRNSVPHESQPNIGNSVELPKPLPASMIDASILRDDANGDKDDESNHVRSAEELSTQDLLNEHIKRGKKIRARLLIAIIKEGIEYNEFQSTVLQVEQRAPTTDREVQRKAHPPPPSEP